MTRKILFTFKDSTQELLWRLRKIGFETAAFGVVISSDILRDEILTGSIIFDDGKSKAEFIVGKSQVLDSFQGWEINVEFQFSETRFPHLEMALLKIITIMENEGLVQSSPVIEDDICAYHREN